MTSRHGQSAQVFAGLINSTGLEVLQSILPAFVNSTASGNAQAVAAVTGSRVVVVGALVTNNSTAGNNIVNFQSGSTAISGNHMLAAGGGGWARDATLGSYLFRTKVGGALNVNLSSTGSVGVDVSYFLLST